MKSLPTDTLAKQNGCRFDDTQPKRIKLFAKKYCGVDLLRWQYEEVIAPIFGWVRKNNRLRYRRAHLWVSKKQGKSFLLAIIATHKCVTSKTRTKTIVMSGVKEQTDEIWQCIEDFAANNPTLEKRLWFRKDKDIIQDRKTKSQIKIISGKGDAKSGFNCDLLIIDEFFELHPAYARQTWHKVKDAGMARPDSLVITISHANYNHNCPAYDCWHQSHEILEGRSDDWTTYALHYGVGEFEDWHNPELWWPQLPGCPELVPREWYLEEYENVKDSVVDSVQFRTFHLNQLVSAPQTWIIEKNESKMQMIERSDRAKQLISKKAGVYGKAPGAVIKRKATDKDADNALKAWMLKGHQRFSVPDSWRRSADLVECDYEAKQFFCRAQATDTTDGTGEQMLNGSILKELVEAKQWEGSLLEHCHVINDPIERAGEPIHFATNDDTDSYGAYKKQNETLVNAGLEYDKVTLNSFMVTTAVYPISISYMLNPNFRALDHINRVQGARLRRTILRDIVSGNGSAKPTGFLGSVAVGAYGYSNALQPEDIRELWYSVDAEYRKNAIFVAHDSTVKSLETSLMDVETGVRYWGVDLNSAPYDQLRDRSLVTNNSMDEMEAGVAKKVLAFGDFSYHKVRFVGPPQLVRDDSRLVDSLSVFFGAYQLVDSGYVNPGNMG